MDYQKYFKSGGDKGKRKDRVLKKSRRKVVVDYAVKQALAVWGDTSIKYDASKKIEDVSMLAAKDSEIFYSSLFALREKSDGEEKNEVTLFYIKKNKYDYSPKKIKKLANVLLNSVCELTAERELLEDKVENLEHEKLALTIQLFEVGDQSLKLKSKNKDLMDQLKKMDESDGKGKKKASNIQINLEEKLKNSQKLLITTLRKNEELERDMVHLKKDLNKSLK